MRFSYCIGRDTASLNITFDDWSSVAKFRTLIKKMDLSDLFVFSVTLSTVYICWIIVIIVCKASVSAICLGIFRYTHFIVLIVLFDITVSVIAE